MAKQFQHRKDDRQYRKIHHRPHRPDLQRLPYSLRIFEVAPCVEIEEQKQLVADYFPPSVEVVEAINNNGHRTVIFVGITAKESNAIEGLIEEKEQLRAEAARQQEKPSLPSHLSFLESDVEEALDPSVPATPPLSDHIKAPETPAKTATFSTEKATPHSYRQ